MFKSNREKELWILSLVTDITAPIPKKKTSQADKYTFERNQ
jgi:hypothetical protein